jgi:5-formyltetrahydrofolate cyclo-ligase
MLDRVELSPNLLAQKSQQICEWLGLFPPFTQAQTIASFFSYKQEPDLISLVDDRRWLFPHCAQQKTLQWYPWRRGEALAQGKYGIVEPMTSKHPVPTTAIELILVPALACDRDKYRLGYGGGYYDRFFAQVDRKRITAIGIVLEKFCCQEVPKDPWDQPLDYVCTELGLF